MPIAGNIIKILMSLEPKEIVYLLNLLSSPVDKNRQETKKP